MRSIYSTTDELMLLWDQYLKINIKILWKIKNYYFIYWIIKMFQGFKSFLLTNRYIIISHNLYNHHNASIASSPLLLYDCNYNNVIMHTQQFNHKCKFCLHMMVKFILFIFSFVGTGGPHWNNAIIILHQRRIFLTRLIVP